MNQNTVDDTGFGTSGVETGPTVESVRVDRPARRTVLAGIGAVATACDTAEETFDRLVDRGQQVQAEWQGRTEQFRRQNAGATGRFRDYFRSAMDAFLDGLNVPSKADVDTINVKLNIVTRKLDDLQMQSMSSTAVEPEPAVTPPTSMTGDLAT